MEKEIGISNAIILDERGIDISSMHADDLVVDL